MKINSIGYNSIASTQPKVNFGNKQSASAVGVQKAAAVDSDETFKKIGVAALSVLGGIGVALVLRNQINDVFTTLTKSMKKSKRNISAKNINILSGKESGPKFDMGTNGKAISNAWKNYIKDIETRISSRKENYTEIFIQNSKELDDLENKALKIVANRKVA